jgi:hypothetical protein
VRDTHAEINTEAQRQRRCCYIQKEAHSETYTQLYRKTPMETCMCSHKPSQRYIHTQTHAVIRHRNKHAGTGKHPHTHSDTPIPAHPDTHVQRHKGTARHTEARKQASTVIGTHCDIGRNMQTEKQTRH